MAYVSPAFHLFGMLSQFFGTFGLLYEESAPIRNLGMGDREEFFFDLSSSLFSIIIPCVDSFGVLTKLFSTFFTCVSLLFDLCGLCCASVSLACPRVSNFSALSH